MNRVALYIRLSVEDNGKDSDSIANQLKLGQEYLADHPSLQLIDTYIDNGYTGTNFDRPEFNRMLQDAQSAKIDCIVVKDLSRLSRNYIEAGEFLEKICPFLGIRFISINDNYDTNTLTATDELGLSIRNIINDYYAKDISKKVSSALENRMLQGIYIGNWAPYGYLLDPDGRGHLLPDPQTAPIVLQIYQWRAEGMSYMGINHQLNNLSIPSPSEYKRQQGIDTNHNKRSKTILWNKHMIKLILSDEVYRGHLVQRKNHQNLARGISYHTSTEQEIIRVENTHEPIVPESLFAKVQELNINVKKNTKTNYGKYAHLPQGNNIFKGKFVCTDCGSVMKLYRSFNTQKTRAYFTFKCPTAEEHRGLSCAKRRIKQEVLEQTILTAIQTQINLFLDENAAIAQLIAQKKQERKPAINQSTPAALKQKLEKKRSLFTGLYIDYKKGILTKDEYLTAKQLYSEQIKSLEQELQDVESKQHTQETNLFATHQWIQLVQQYAHAESLTEDMVRAFIQQIRLSADGTVAITFRFADEFMRLSEQKEALQNGIAG